MDYPLKISPKKYRALFFDLDHTLCDTSKADELGRLKFRLELIKYFPSSICQSISVDYLEAIYGHKNNELSWRKREHEGELDFRARLLHQTLLANSVGVVSTDLTKKLALRFMELRIQNLKFFPGVCELLENLRSIYSLAVVSNGPPFSQQPKVDKLQLKDRVDHIVIGGSLATQKPHSLIFFHACKLSGCRPEEALHIGDKLEVDVLGAISAGIDSVWVYGDQQRINPDPRPDYMISNVIELKNVLFDLV